MISARFAALLASGSLALALLSGCGAHSADPALQIGAQLQGNWSFAPAAAKPASAQTSGETPTLNLGFTQGAYETVSAVARLTGVSCVSPDTDILLTGSVNGSNQLTLISQPFSGTTLTLTGAVAPAGSSIVSAAWSFAGGSCASLGKMNVTATDYTEITGSFAGNFTDGSGNQLAVSALLQQTTQPDSNGQFSLSGTAGFPTNTCFVQQPTITQSTVTGSSLSMTYSDPGSAAVLTATGSFNASATQLTIANWTIASGPCAGDTGTGLLTSQ